MVCSDCTAHYASIRMSGNNIFHRNPQPTESYTSLQGVEEDEWSFELRRIDEDAFELLGGIIEMFERGLPMRLVIVGQTVVRTVQFELEMTSRRKSIVGDLLIDYRLVSNLSAGMGISVTRQSYYSSAVTETLMDEGLSYIDGGRSRIISEERREGRSEYALGAIMEFRNHISLSDRFFILPALSIRYPLSSNAEFEDEKQMVLHFGISAMFWI